MYKKASDLVIFKTSVLKERYGDIQKVIQDQVEKLLLEKLTDSQKKLFQTVNYHYWDPNYPENGRDMRLLEFLVFEALPMDFINKGDHFYTELFLYDLEKYTGINSLAEFEEEIKRVNEAWKTVAKIKIKNPFDEKPNISFEFIAQTVS